MIVYPLKSMTITEATEKQFALVDAITQEFKGSEILGLGDVGVHPQGNIPQVTRKVEAVIARFFKQEDAVFVRGAGTGAIREALASIVKANDLVLVHEAPIYSTTRTSMEQLGLKTITCDFNSTQAIETCLQDNPNIKAALVQITRQSLDDSYNLGEVIQTIKQAGIPVVTDDNYAVMKIAKIGVEEGADLSCFSCFKLLGPEGIGLVVGKKSFIDVIRSFHYSGGSQTQGFEALEALRGLVFAPVTHAVQAEEAEKVAETINQGGIAGISKAVIANAQSKVILVKLDRPIAKYVLQEAQEKGAAPYPVGAESKYELVPMFYRVSKTMREGQAEFEEQWIRINPMRAGATTVLRILKEVMEKVNSCS